MSGLLRGFGSQAARRDRLAASIRKHRIQLEACPTPPPCLQQQQKLLDEARQALDGGRLDEAWACLHTESRLGIRGLGADALHARAVALRHEAGDKLHGWRRDAVKALLDPSLWKDPIAEAPRLERWRVLLEEAEWVVHGHFENVYHKNRVLGVYLLAVGWTLAISWAACIAAAATGHFTLPGLSPLASTRSLLSWSALGLLGGAFSAALSMLGDSGKKRITEQLSGGIGTLVRVGAGAVSGLAAGILASAGVVTIAAGAGWAPLALAFAAGFSERLVVKAMGAASK